MRSYESRQPTSHKSITITYPFKITSTRIAIHCSPKNNATPQQLKILKLVKGGRIFPKANFRLFLYKA
jgi:hypothetical protein